MTWSALVLAAGRGPKDPSHKAFAVEQKCLLPLAGKPMLHHVVAALHASRRFARITVSIEEAGLLERALGPLAKTVSHAMPDASAPLSVFRAFSDVPLGSPTLVTTADHPLLRQDIIADFTHRSSQSGADLTVGLATADIILASYPKARRTFLRFGRQQVSGCNLYGFNTAAALKIIRPWHVLEQSRKRPWRLIRALGAGNLLLYLVGGLSLDAAFAAASQRLGLVVKPILLPFPESAIDVDKPADLELAESILRNNERYQPAIM
jgi:GTP:adenosylcobinamide-phosphate guanylyltransferase